MSIRWSNVVAIALAIFAVVIGLKCSRQIGQLLSSIAETNAGAGLGKGSGGPLVALMAFGLLLVTIVAIVRILQNDRSEK